MVYSLSTRVTKKCQFDETVKHLKSKEKKDRAGNKSEDGQGWKKWRRLQNIVILFIHAMPKSGVTRFKGVHIKAELDFFRFFFGSWRVDFWGEMNSTDFWEITLQSKNEKQKQTQPTWDSMSGNRTPATAVGGLVLSWLQRHHCYTIWKV